MVTSTSRGALSSGLDRTGVSYEYPTCSYVRAHVLIVLKATGLCAHTTCSFKAVEEPVDVLSLDVYCVVPVYVHVKVYTHPWIWV